ncbi:MAG: hypothetical protein R3F59_20255 [Myxococcota bacterium]
MLGWLACAAAWAQGVPEDVPDAEAAAEADAGDDPWDRRGWGFGGLPAVNYNSDEGFGFGVVASLYRYDGHLQPYKTAINLVLFMTTKGIHNHWLEVDTLELGGKPLRLTVRGEFSSTATNNYCGVGPEVTCDPAVAEAAIDAVDPPLQGEAREDALRHYYRLRYLMPNGSATLRWAIDPMPHKVELLLGWRGRGIVPGDFRERDPWPHSLYASDFPGGEAGFVSLLQAGVMVDDRDNEPAPIRGYWVEGTVRAATIAFGSTYDFVGWNVTLRGYHPLGTDRVVFADRVMFDQLVGEAPVVELVWPGGTQQYTFYGSLNAGRGIRLARYVGKLKAMNQSEVRATFWQPEIAGVHFDVTALGFLDLGFVGADPFDFGPAFSHPLPGTGGGCASPSTATVVRADAGVSPIEDWSPRSIDIKNTFSGGYDIGGSDPYVGVGWDRQDRR